LSARVDQNQLRVGKLLHAGLHDILRDRRVLVLLWSNQAAGSSRVAAELLTAFHLNRCIVPCILGCRSAAALSIYGVVSHLFVLLPLI